MAELLLLMYNVYIKINLYFQNDRQKKSLTLFKNFASLVCLNCVFSLSLLSNCYKYVGIHVFKFAMPSIVLICNTKLRILWLNNIAIL